MPAESLCMDTMKLQERVEAAPFNRFLGLTVTEIDDGALEFELPFRDEFARSDGNSIHGGVLASALDAAATFVISMAIDEKPLTVNLEVDYIRPTSATDAVVTAEAVRAGSTVAFSIAEVSQRYQGELVTVARGRGLFSSADPE